MSVLNIVPVIPLRDRRRDTQFSTIDNLSCFETQTPPALLLDTETVNHSVTGLITSQLSQSDMGLVKRSRC